jgi:sigma-E factor negative regulatory protein RseC
MEEKGKVIELLANEAKVEVMPSAICSHCSSTDACGSIGTKAKVVLAKNPIEAKVGDLVKLELKEKARATSILLVFGLPITFLLAGIIIGEIISGDKLAAILGGAGLVIAFIIVKMIDRLVDRKESFLPTIVEKINEDSLETACPEPK